MTRLETTTSAARRFLLNRQGLLSAPRATLRPARLRGCAGSEITIARLEAVQIDPVAVIAANQHLVLRERVTNYRPRHLEQLLAARRIFEYFANARCYLPMADYPWFAPLMRQRLAAHAAQYAELEDTVAHVLDRIANEGPLAARDFASDKAVGFWDTDQARTKKTSLALELLWADGRLLVHHREGSLRFYDVPERIVPPALQEAAAGITLAAAREAVLRKYCRAYGLFDLGDPRFGWQRMTATERRAWAKARVADGFLTEVAIAGVKRPYYVLREEAEDLIAARDWRPEPRIHLLPPLDNLLWRRERLQDLFAFDYTWEIYIPAAKRQYGSYTMPVLEGDRLIARLDARANRESGRLEVARLTWEADLRLGPTRLGRVERALQNLAAFLGLSEGVVGLEGGHRRPGPDPMSPGRG